MSIFSNLPRDTRWLVISGAAAMAASFLTKTVLAKGWNEATGDDPPENPAASSVSWGQALAWTAAASLAAGLAQLVARRGVAKALGGPVPRDTYD